MIAVLIGSHRVSSTVKVCGGNITDITEIVVIAALFAIWMKKNEENKRKEKKKKKKKRHITAANTFTCYRLHGY